MPTCTEKELALLNSALKGAVDPERVAEVIAERLTPASQERVVEAWAEMFRACQKKEKAWEALGIDGIGRAIGPIWDDLERRARARFEEGR